MLSIFARSIFVEILYHVPYAFILQNALQSLVCRASDIAFHAHQSMNFNKRLARANITQRALPSLKEQVYPRKMLSFESARYPTTELCGALSIQLSTQEVTLYSFEDPD